MVVASAPWGDLMHSESFIGLFEPGRKLSSRPDARAVSGEGEPFLVAHGSVSASRDGCHLHLWGWIYNGEELRRRCCGVEGDVPEVLLALFLREGIDGFRQVDGKYTVVIVFGGEVCVVRDRLGAGPRVYYADEGFASSLADVTRFVSASSSPDVEAILAFLWGSYIPSPRTPFAGIRKLAPGDVLVARNGSLRVETLFDYADYCGTGKLDIDEDHAVAEYEKRLRGAIARRIAGRSSPGTLLSGGFDSSGALAALRDVYDGPINTFSVGFSDSRLTEHEAARLTSRRFGTTHREHIIGPADMEPLPSLIEAWEEPFSEAGIFINNASMRMASGTSDVVLGGDGNDQLWGTGAREAALYHLISRTGAGPVTRLSARGLDLLPSDSTRVFRLQFHARSILGILSRGNFGLDSEQIRRIAARACPWHGDIAGLAVNRQHYAGYDELYDLRVYHGALRLDANEMILNKASRISAMHGVNLAFPYMDLDLYRFVPRLPRPLRTKGTYHEILRGRGTSKYVHRRLMRAKLPEEITRRKKQGGFTPLSLLFADPTSRQLIAAYVVGSRAVAELLDRPAVEGIFRAYDAVAAMDDRWYWHRHVRANQLLNLLVLALWWDIFMHGDRRDQLSDYLARRPGVSAPATIAAAG